MPSFTMQTAAYKKPRARFMHLGFWRVGLFKIYSFFLVAQTGTPGFRLRVTVTQRPLEPTIEASKRGGAIFLNPPPLKRTRNQSPNRGGAVFVREEGWPGGTRSRGGLEKNTLPLSTY